MPLVAHYPLVGWDVFNDNFSTFDPSVWNLREASNEYQPSEERIRILEAGSGVGSVGYTPGVSTTRWRLELDFEKYGVSGNADAFLVDFYTDGSYAAHDTTINGYRLAYDWYDGSIELWGPSGNITNTGYTLPDGRHHIILTYDEGVISTEVNGDQKFSYTISSPDYSYGDGFSFTGSDGGQTSDQYVNAARVIDLTQSPDVRGGHHGTVTGTSLDDGLLGANARYFDGSGDYIYSVIGNLPDAYTIGMWVNPSVSNSISGFSDGVPTSGTHEKEFYTNSDGTVTFRGYDSSDQHVTSTTNICDGGWHHIMATAADGKSVKLYIDSVQEDSNTVGTLYDGYTTGYFTLGIGSQISSYLNGHIFDARIANHAATQQEINYLYEVVDTPGTWTSSKKVI